MMEHKGLSKPHKSKHAPKVIDLKWESYYANIKKQMKVPEDQKDIILRKRILKFFQDYKLETDIFYTPRKEVKKTNLINGFIITHSLFLYGIDFLTLDKISLYFEPYTVNVEVYDESHCAVTFSSEEQLI